MDIKERIKNGINTMKMRNVDSECINLIEKDYRELLMYFQEQAYHYYRSKEEYPEKITEFAGLPVYETKGFEGKSFVSIMRKELYPNTDKEYFFLKDKYKNQNDHFKLYSKHFIEQI